MLLRELFDKPVAYEWTSQGDESWEAEFIVGEVMYEFLAYMSNPYPEEHEDAEVEIEFYHRTETGVPTHKVSGVGNQHQVFATVVAIMAEFLKARKPDILIFSAAEPNRAKLYKRMIATLLPHASIVHRGTKFFVRVK